MAWSWILPPFYKNQNDYQNGAFDNPDKVHQNTESYGFYPQMSDGAFIDVPSLKKINILVECLIANSEGKNAFITITSENHSLSIKREGKNYFSIIIDGQNLCSQIPIIINKKCRLYITVNISANGGIELWNNGNKVGEYKGLILEDEPIKKITFTDTTVYNSCTLYFAIASENPIPQSATVKIVTPEVETDWEKNENGTYQTSDTGKTMKLTTPKDCATKGKAIVLSAPFLYNATAGGNVNGVTIHSAVYDADKALLNDACSMGFRTGDDTVFTTRG